MKFYYVKWPLSRNVIQMFYRQFQIEFYSITFINSFFFIFYFKLRFPMIQQPLSLRLPLQLAVKVFDQWLNWRRQRMVARNRWMKRNYYRRMVIDKAAHHHH